MPSLLDFWLESQQEILAVVKKNQKFMLDFATSYVNYSRKGKIKNV